MGLELGTCGDYTPCCCRCRARVALGWAFIGFACSMLVIFLLPIGIDETAEKLVDENRVMPGNEHADWWPPSYQPTNQPTKGVLTTAPLPSYDKYIVCSWGGVRSKMVIAWLQRSAPHAQVFHVHDRFPPPKLTYVTRLGERFSAKEMTAADAGKTAVIFLYRNPAKSISSRISKNHCLHIQGRGCNALGPDKDMNLIQYVKNGRDDFMLRAHWKAYAEDRHEYPIIFINSTELWEPSVFNEIVPKLGLPLNTQPPGFLANGDQYHREENADVLRELRHQYDDLTKTILSWRRAHASK